MSTSRSLNRASLIGNLTRNPILKQTSSNSVVCTFGIATNTSWKDSNGNVKERTEFHNIVAWNKLAEICANLLAVGMNVFIEGEIRTRSWEDENGVRHYRTEIKADNMILLDDKGRSASGSNRSDDNDDTSDSAGGADDEPTEQGESKDITAEEDADSSDDLF